jgi:hypothetical protein
MLSNNTIASKTKVNSNQWNSLGVACGNLFKIGAVSVKGLGANGLVTVMTELSRIKILCLQHIAHSLK